MFIDDNNNRKELNLIPRKRAKLLGRWDWNDLLLFGIPAFVLIIVLFTTGFAVVTSVICGILIVVWGFFCFANSKNSGKLRERIWKWISHGIFGRKVWSAKEIGAYYRFKECTGQHLKYVNEEKTGYISIYRITGYDLTLLEIPEQDKRIDALCRMFGHRSDFDIMSASILYQMPKKQYNLKFDNSTIKWLKEQYDQKINELNHNIKNAQQTYFLVINGNTIAENERHCKNLLADAKNANLNFVPASETEIEQLLAIIWPETHISLKNPAKHALKRIVARKTYLQLFDTNDDWGFMAFRSLTLPSIVGQSWLQRMFNNPHYALYLSNKHVDHTSASQAIRNVNDTILSFMKSRWYTKGREVTEIDRMEMEQVKAEIQTIAEQISDRSHLYEMRECCFFVIFHADTKKQLNNYLDEFKNEFETYEKGFEINDLNYLQMEAFTYTRMYELPSLQFRTDYIAKIKNLFKRSGKKNSALNAPLSVVSNSAVHILNTSIGLGFPFVNNISSGDQQTWYKGTLIDWQGIDVLNRPIFEDYWTVDDSHASFSRFILAQTGSGKTWTAKRDMIQDRLDDRFILVLDPKPDYGKLTIELGGENIVIGRVSTKEKSNRAINVWDILVTPADVNLDGSDTPMNPLDRTYLINEDIIKTLLSLDESKSKDKAVLSAWGRVQKNVYEGKCKFKFDTDFSKIPKNRMPLTEDFYQEALTRSQDKNESNRDGFSELSITLEKYSKNGVYGYLFNNHSNVDWTTNRMFCVDLSNVARTNLNILGTFSIALMNISTELMIANKNSGKEFITYVDETHMIRRNINVLKKLNQFVRICRSHNAGLCLIDQGLNVIKAESRENDLYSEIFEQTQYTMFLKSSSNDVDAITRMLSYSGKPMSQVEHDFIVTADKGSMMSMVSPYERYRMHNDVSFWLDIMTRTKSEGQRPNKN